MRSLLNLTFASGRDYDHVLRHDCECSSIAHLMPRCSWVVFAFRPRRRGSTQDSPRWDSCSAVREPLRRQLLAGLATRWLCPPEASHGLGRVSRSFCIFRACAHFLLFPVRVCIDSSRNRVLPPSVTCVSVRYLTGLSR